MNLLSLMLLVATAACGVYAIDYCSKDLCGKDKHIACNNNGKFAASCPSDAKMVPISNALKNVIVNGHNEKRNIVASGATKLKAACRMGTISWDNELASLAAYNVKQCKMKHDACHNTDVFKYSGQSLSWRGYFDPLNSESEIRGAIESWYKEINNCKMEYINSYPSNYKGPDIGHFTVMVAEKNIRVGCAASSYSESGKPYKVFLLACNYATTNLYNRRIYAACSKPASDCNRGTNPKYSSLCAASEPIDPNP